MKYFEPSKNPQRDIDRYLAVVVGKEVRRTGLRAGDVVLADRFVQASILHSLVAVRESDGSLHLGSHQGDTRSPEFVSILGESLLASTLSVEGVADPSPISTASDYRSKYDPPRLFMPEEVLSVSRDMIANWEELPVSVQGMISDFFAATASQPRHESLEGSEDRLAGALLSRFRIALREEFTAAMESLRQG